MNKISNKVLITELSNFYDIGDEEVLRKFECPEPYNYFLKTGQLGFETRVRLLKELAYTERFYKYQESRRRRWVAHVWKTCLLLFK